MRYQMTIHPALEAGDPTVKFGFETAEQMLAAKETAAGLLLFLQDTAGVMKSYSYSFFLEERVEGKRKEWDSEI